MTARPNQVTFRFTTREPPAEVSSTSMRFLNKHYRVRQEPPANLPRSKRTHMFLLQPR
jgi:hypothetical protein